VKCADALRTVSRTWARFTAEQGSGKDLFRAENTQLIQDLAQATGVTGKALGGAYIRVLNELWGEEEQEEWHRRAREETDVEAYVDLVCSLTDVFSFHFLFHSNQEELMKLCLQTLRALAQSGQLGEVEFCLWAAYKTKTGATECFRYGKQSF
jgi:hypothetical protein